MEEPLSVAVIACSQQVFLWNTKHIAICWGPKRHAVRFPPCLPNYRVDTACTLELSIVLLALIMI